MTWLAIPALLGCLIAACSGHRVARSAGDAPDAGSCIRFALGGISSFHFYICCNNCEGGNSSDTCDRTTYQGASTNQYCGSCGVDTTAGNGYEFGSEFGCGGCDGQSLIEQDCTRIYTDIPGTCWIFAWCFRSDCIEKYDRKKRSVDSAPTCYSGLCDPGETTDNCAADCCYKKNPDRCSWNTNKCLDRCCGTPDCCLTSSGTGHLWSSPWTRGLYIYLLPVLGYTRYNHI